jgi:Tfp pilus assembly protein PilV
LSALLPFENYLWAAGLLAILCLGLVAVHHERTIGKQDIIAAYAAARADEHKKIVAEEAAMQAAANQAAEERDAAQNALNSYMAAHPLGHVWVCHPNNQSTGVPESPSIISGASIVGARSAVVPPVSDGSASSPSDIGAELGTIVQAAAAVSGNFAELQKRTVTSNAK